MSALTAASQNVASMNKLSKQDQEAFDFAEKTVERGLETYLTVGLSLATIRENKWYKSLGFSSFETYVLERFNISHNYANKLMRAAFAVERIAAAEPTEPNENWYHGTSFDAPSGVSEGSASVSLVLPQTERVARPLTTLPPDEVASVWKGVTEEAKQTGAPITAAQVQQAVDTHQGKTKPQPSVHHPAPTTPIAQASAPKAAKTTPKANSPTDAPVKSAVEALRWTHESEMTLTNAYGTEITTIYQIREEKDGKFHLWRNIRETVSGHGLGGGPINVYSSYALAARAAQTDANAAQGIEPGDTDQ